MTTTKPVPAGLANLADFKPRAFEPAPEPIAEIKHVAESHGFVERNAPTVRKRRKGANEPVCSFTARVTVRSANAFIEYCERERLSYRDGFDRLISLLTTK